MSLGTFTYENGPLEFDDFPHTEDPVYVLGESYSAIFDREELRDDILSRLWITYRKNFQNIGGTGPSTDQGWGCMLRCGQMMLAQTLLLHHLGRDWRWRPERADDKYWKILKMFEDKKMATYSIHQIASMGESEGKAVGQWFGPNTIVQVFKRLSIYDTWSNIAIHVALDNVVITDEIYALCKSSGSKHSRSPNSQFPLPEGEQFSKFVNDVSPKSQAKHRTVEGEVGGSPSSATPPRWKPLLLVIPLRLGLTDINPIYFESLKKCFTAPQSVGIIGGKPNHAHWFIGYFGKELIYLDPHTTQYVVDLDDRGASDASYHCPTPPSRMSFSKLDPSIAVGFYCATEEDFRKWCQTFTTKDARCQTMFEIRQDAPQAWPYDHSCVRTVRATSPPPTTTSDPRFGSSPRVGDFGVFDSLVSGASPTDDEEFEMI